MSDLTSRFWMRKIRGDEISAVRGEAAADGHELIAPSHVFTRNGETIGYASVAQVPLVLPWFHTKKCGAFASVYFVNQIENLMGEALPEGHNGLVCVPFVPGSPFEPHVERLGFVNAGKVNLCFKKVK